MPTDGKYVLHHTNQKKGLGVYIYYMLAWYYRKNKKPYRQTLKHLGKLTKDEIKRYKIGIEFLNKNPQINLCNLEEIEILNTRSYLPCALGDYFWDFWELNKVFGKEKNSRKNITTADIAKILTTIRWVEASSKNFTQELYPETCLPEITGVSVESYNASRIYRELERIDEKKEELGKHILEIARAKRYTKGEVLFYDLSSGNMSGLKCVLAKWGHSKDGYRTHVVLLLVITPEGYPIYWEILEGNTADTKTIEHLIKKIDKVFGKIESVLCFDRGMVSDDNLRLLEERKEEIKFITALDGNQISHFANEINFSKLEEVKKMDYQKDKAKIKKELEAEGYEYGAENLFYQELKISSARKKEIEKKTNKLRLAKRRYFLAYNPELAYLSQKHRKERVQEFQLWIEEYNQDLAGALANKKEEKVLKTIKNELKKNRINDVDIAYNLIKYQVTNKNEKGNTKKAWTYKVVLEDIGESAYKQAEQYDGLWMLITNMKSKQEADFFSKTDFSNYFDVYRLKNNIEESFKILSQFVGVEPFYLYKTKHLQAHFTICVLSYLLDITILNKIRNNTDVENMSLQRLFFILKKCKQNTIQLDKDTVVSKITKANKKQKQILKALDCLHLISKHYLIKKNITAIKS